MQEYDECCPGYEDSCRPDLAPHTSAAFDPVNDVEGCEKYRFAEGLDEMLMNCEAGLYFKFEEENGIPKSCPGLENFNMETWKSEGDDNIRWMREPTVRRAFEMDCPLQDRRAGCRSSLSAFRRQPGTSGQHPAQHFRFYSFTQSPRNQSTDT